MAGTHRGFWPDLISKIGVPIFAGTLVGCVLKDDVTWVHGGLLTLGLALIYLGHRWDYHSH